MDHGGTIRSVHCEQKIIFLTFFQYERTIGCLEACVVAVNLVRELSQNANKERDIMITDNCCAYNYDEVVNLLQLK